MKARETSRTRGAYLWCKDRKRMRFVVYRRAGGVTRKTSVRFQVGGMWSAFIRTVEIARRLKKCPADQLSSFKFTP